MTFSLLFTLLFSISAQERVVTGTVIDPATNEPLPGVAVVAKGTGVGVVTDIDGKYRLSVPAGATTLVFQFVGFKDQEVAIGSRSVVDVNMMPDVNELEEVVVSSYGIPQKRDVAGSVGTVSGEVIENMPVQSFDRAMQGRIAGVQVSSTSGAPGGGLNVIVRGQGSINNNTPLYIVDGVQVASGGVTGQGSSNALAGVNPNDILSIEVLKDAASSAIYGAQAANGVVLITTKRGRQDGKVDFEVTYQKGSNRPLNLYDVMDARQFAEIRAVAYQNAGLPVEEAYALYGDPNDPNLESTDWVDAAFRNANIDIFDISARGGNEQTSFYFSGSFTEQEGIVIGSSYKRGTGRLNMTSKLTDKFTIRPVVSLAVQESFGSIANGNFVNGPFQGSFVAQPGSPIYDSLGNFSPYPINGTGHNFSYNIIQGVDQELRKGLSVQTISSLQAEYQILPQLSAIAYVGIDYINTRDDNNRPSTIPAFSSYGGSATAVNRRETNLNSNVNLNYSQTFNDLHAVGATFGYEYKYLSVDRFVATGRGFANPSFRYLDEAATPFSVGGSFTDFARQGVFGRVDYSYNNKYSLNATLRRDGSSRFGENNRYGTFYAIGAAWSIIDEAFMDNVGFLQNLKLRGSYGKVGNSEGIGNFTAQPQVGVVNQYRGVGGSAFTVLQNDLLSWEEATMINVGLDFGIFNSRINGAIDVWKENTGNQLFSIPLVADTGFEFVQGNAGEVLNEGIDFELSSVNFDKKGFRWTSTFNLSLQRNELLSLPNGEERIGNTLIVGEPISFYYLVPYAGVNPANGRPMYRDANENLTYLPTIDDQRVTGSPIPTYFGGFNNSVSFKGFYADVFFQWEGGHDAFLGDFFNLAASGGFNDNQLVSQLDYWKQPGDITSVPRPIEGGNDFGINQQSPNGLSTTRYQQDASYVRLKQVQIGYQVPSNFTNKVGFDRFEIWAQALNLATWTKFEGIDPEVVSSNSSNGTSTFGNFPNGRQFTLGVSLGF